MSRIRKAALVVLAALYLCSLFASVLAPANYATQFREHAGEPPSRAFPLGVDELGRDRFSRLLFGSQISLLLAPAAALLATLLAAGVGMATAFLGKWADRLLGTVTNLLLSLPMLFLMLMVRGMLPLNVDPWVSAAITFLLLGLLGWPAAARVAHAAARSALGATFLLQAESAGLTRSRILLSHLLPHLRPVLLAQFLMLIPLFILGEANLSLLGLGVSEPLPSWGSLLAELNNISSLAEKPWLLAPAAALFASVLCFSLVSRNPETGP